MLLTHGKKYLNLLSFKNVSKFIPFKFEEFQNNAWIRNSNEIEQVTIIRAWKYSYFVLISGIMINVCKGKFLFVIINKTPYS